MTRKILKNIPRDSRYLAMEEQRDALNDGQDCALKSVAATTGIEYAKIRQAFTRKGRRLGDTTPRVMTRAVIEEAGFTIEVVDPRYFINRYQPVSHRTLMHVTTYHPDRYRHAWADGHSYIIFARRHAVGVVNGVVVDWARGRSLRIREIWRIVKK